MKPKILKKVLSALLCTALTLSACPLTASAKVFHNFFINVENYFNGYGDSSPCITSWSDYTLDYCKGGKIEKIYMEGTIYGVEKGIIDTQYNEEIQNFFIYSFEIDTKDGKKTFDKVTIDPV